MHEWVAGPRWPHHFISRPAAADVKQRGERKVNEAALGEGAASLQGDPGGFRAQSCRTKRVSETRV
jgi:hypothetical protein